MNEKQMLNELYNATRAAPYNAQVHDNLKAIAQELFKFIDAHEEKVSEEEQGDEE